MATDRPGQLILLAVLAGMAAVAVASWAPWERPPEPRAAGIGAGAAICRGRADAGPGRAAMFRTPAGVGVAVVAPSDYDPRHPYGLLVAYPPAGYDARSTEWSYGLTGPATAAGWVVAYPDHAPLSRAGIAAQAAVPAAVASRWCIDPERVALVGHSDGGTVAEGAALSRQPTALRATAIVASAAGIDGRDLVAEGCPAAPPDMLIVHNPADQRFPGYGAQAAAFWADCLMCPGPPEAPEPGRCTEAPACASGARLRHCAVTERHERLPDLAALALGFLETGDRLHTRKE